MAGLATSRALSPNAVSRVIVDAAMKVHSSLGPGLLESAYKACLRYELEKRGCVVRTEVPLPVVYDDIKLELGYRIDLLVNDVVVVEVKATDGIAPVFEAQIISYLRLSGRSLGLLINFHVPHLKDGIRRFVLGTEWK
jgi:GxxExxY protein